MPSTIHKKRFRRGVGSRRPPLFPDVASPTIVPPPVFVNEIDERRWLLLQKEQKNQPDAEYLIEHESRPYDVMINEAMVKLLCDWLIHVVTELKIDLETIHLAMNYVRRYLAIAPIVRTRLQLLGATCFFIAAKFEEILPPHPTTMVCFADGMFTEAELRLMELSVLKELEFKVSPVTANVVFWYNDSAMNLPAMVARRSEMLLLLALQEGRFLDVKCSILAAAAVAVAQASADGKEWSSEQAQITGYGAADIEECVVKLHTEYMKLYTSPLTGIRDRYAEYSFSAPKLRLNMRVPEIPR
jgi:cyclin A